LGSTFALPLNTKSANLISSISSIETSPSSYTCLLVFATQTTVLDRFFVEITADAYRMLYPHGITADMHVSGYCETRTAITPLPMAFSPPAMMPRYGVNGSFRVARVSMVQEEIWLQP